jgi:hypothetical protein
VRRKSRWFVLAVLVALAAATVALAAGSLTTKTVNGTFTISSSKTKSNTCTGADGTYTSLHGEYKGTAASADTRLAGPITIKAHSTVNQTTGLGWIRGSLRIDTVGHGDTKANFSAVISGGQLNGFLNGKVHNDNGNLLGGVNAAYNTTTGVGAGSIGSTASIPAIIASGKCEPTKTKPPKAPHPPKGPKAPKTPNSHAKHH